MKFSTREDIEAPIDSVFELITQFDIYERAAMRRGAEVRRVDTLTEPGLGARWDARVMLRGKERDVTLEVTTFAPLTDLVVSVNSNNVAGILRCEFFALSRSRTRMMMTLDVRPMTLPARLLIQSLKLTKSTLNQKFKNRVADLVVNLEDRHRRLA